MRSKTYNVKSNAARAAAKYGIKRDELIAVSGGWLFNIPSDTAPQSPTEPATAAVDGAATDVPANGEALTSAPAAPADEPIEWGGYDYMVVNGEKAAELVEQAGEPIEVAPAKPKRQRKPKAEKPKADKPAKPAAKGKTDNRAPKEGKGSSLLAAVKADWQPVPKLLEMTGWLPHTLRGYLSRTVKAEGWTLDRDKVDGVTRYRIKV